MEVQDKREKTQALCSMDSLERNHFAVVKGNKRLKVEQSSPSVAADQATAFQQKKTFHWRQQKIKMRVLWIAMEAKKIMENTSTSFIIVILLSEREWAGWKGKLMRKLNLSMSLIFPHWIHSRSESQRNLFPFTESPRHRRRFLSSTETLKGRKEHNARSTCLFVDTLR